MAGETYYYDISADANSCNVGESITITFNYNSNGHTATSTQPLDLYEDGVKIDSIDIINSFYFYGSTYTYTPSTSGEHTICFGQDNWGVIRYSNTLTITVSDGGGASE